VRYKVLTKHFPLQRLSECMRAEKRGKSSLLAHLIYLEIHFIPSLTFLFRLKETRMYINVAGLAVGDFSLVNTAILEPRATRSHTSVPRNNVRH
jgi:hypothetical protein